MVLPKTSRLGPCTTPKSRLVDILICWHQVAYLSGFTYACSCNIHEMKTNHVSSQFPADAEQNQHIGVVGPPGWGYNKCG